MNQSLKEVKLKTLLINPPEEFKKAFFKLPPYPPLAIATLKGFLQSKGYSNIELCDFHEKKLFSSLILKAYKKRFFRPVIKTLSIMLNPVKSIYFFVLESKNKELLEEREAREKWNISLNLCISHALKKRINHDSKIYKNIKEVIMSKKPGIVGITVSHQDRFHDSLQIAKIIKSFNEKIFIVLGGSIITKNINHIIKHVKLKEIIDGFVVGNGEEPLAKLILAINKSEDLSKVPNLYYKNKNRNGFVRSKASFTSKYEHLMIVPDFRGLQFRFLPLRISLGCYWGKCNFCTYRLAHKKYALLNPKEAVRIIKTLIKKYDVEYLTFADNALPPKFLKEMSKQILKEKIKIPWRCMICFDKGFLDENIPKLMKKAGCFEVHPGLESMSPRILRLMNKLHKPQDVKKILRSFKKSGLDTSLTCIIGFPGETKEEALLTLDFLRKNRNLYSACVVQEFCLEEDTVVYKNPSRFNIISIDKSDKSKTQRWGFDYKVGHGLSHKQAKKIVEKTSKEFF